MKTKITQKEIGQRIAQTRKLKGYSQEELATKINISRTSLVQIEQGNRKLGVLELQLISNVLEFSLDHFLSENYSLTVAINTDKKEAKNEAMRISEPSLNADKFINVLLYILEKCAGKPNVGETVICKLLYFADFNYYELYEEHLTGVTYYKFAYGPVPHNLPFILNKMMEEQRVQRIKTNFHDFRQTRYIPLVKAELRELKASEKEVIDRVIDQFGDWSAKRLSEYSHKDIPWLVSDEGLEINYELALYREAPYSVRNYEA